jgi:uncharacterized membrane protein YeaQ/YmgE (transglycosylase-associated protein family)
VTVADRRTPQQDTPGEATEAVAPLRSDPIDKEFVMGIIAWIVLGAIAGFIAEHLTGRRTGFVLATIVGIIGALLGGFLAKAIFHVLTLNTFFNLSTWITAIVGAVILFLVLRMVSGSRRSGRSA